MEKKFTPGPWSAFTDDSEWPSHTNIVAVVPRTDCVFSLPGHHKNDPNVRLIAAAPDLLEELLEICAILDMCSADTGEGMCFDYEGIGDEVTRRHDSITAAIVRALGQ